MSLRYEKTENILQLAIEVPTGEKIKRWRIPPGVLDRLMTFEADEIADLEAAVALMTQAGQDDRARRLKGLAVKIRALMPPNSARRAEPDVEALLQAEGLAMRPGPKPRAATGVVEALRHAVKACRKVRLAYRNRRDGRVNERLVHPYGFLFGHRNYLVAYHEHAKANDVALFSLPNVEQVTPTDEPFERDPGFSLADFAARSFGVFQEEPFDVVWRFRPDAAAVARAFEFHPTQTATLEEDGALTVRFSAGSDLEMAWHLYAWGDAVEVLAPRRLADMVHPNRTKWPALP